MDPSDGGVGVGVVLPKLGFKLKLGGAGVKKKPNNEVKIPKSPPQNEYKTQYFTPAASKFSETPILI